MRERWTRMAPVLVVDRFAPMTKPEEIEKSIATVL